MPVNPNQASVTVTPTSLPTLTLQLQQFDDDARLFFSGNITSVTGNLYGSNDGITYFPIGCLRDADGAPFASGLNVGTFPTSYYINAGNWNYLQFVPTAVGGTSGTISMVSAVDLGGAPFQSAAFLQSQALVLGLSDLNSTDYLAGVGGTF